MSGVCSALVVAASPIFSQSSVGRGVLDGIVTDTSLAPLAGASAWLLGTRLEVTTGANGRFRITSIRAGTYIVVVRRLGFAPVSSALTVVADDTARLAFALVPLEVKLEKVLVRAVTGPLAEFESRRALGFGQFMTETEIEKLNFVGTSDLLQTFHSVEVKGYGVLNKRLMPALKCPMQFYVDGVSISVHNLDADLPVPHEIAGIEVHANTATVPLQYASLGGGTSGHGGGICGVILIWTRR